MIPCPCTKSKVFCTFCETLTKNTGCFCAECGSHIPYRLIGGGNGSDSGFQRGHHVLFISNKAAGEHRHFGGSAHPAQDLGHGAGQQVQTVRQIWRNLIQAFQCDGIQKEYPQNGEKEDLCLVAVPSYGGRIPSAVTDMFCNVKADGTKAILVAVFGNRAIDDTLLELQDVLEASGFVCIAGMEAVAEHSLMHQFGTGRPDQQDEKELLEFAAKIMQSDETQRTPKFPGNRPYREYGGVPLKPVANGKCTSCGLCAKECPEGAIPLNNPKLTDKNKCISCMHCVAVCPKKARDYSKFVSFIAGQKMKKVCSGRKENKLYL